MIHKNIKGILALLVLAGSSLAAVEKASGFGVVDFTKCMMESKYGKTESEGFEAVQNQLQKAIEDLKQQLVDTDNQLRNTDLLDSMSPEAIQALNVKFQNLRQELERYLSQSNQIMQSAQMKLIHTLAEEINQASQIVAKKEKRSLVINKDSTFHFNPDDEITDQVIAQMDTKFETEKKKVEKSPKA